LHGKYNEVNNGSHLLPDPKCTCSRFGFPGEYPGTFLFLFRSANWMTCIEHEKENILFDIVPWCSLLVIQKLWSLSMFQTILHVVCLSPSLPHQNSSISTWPIHQTKYSLWNINNCGAGRLGQEKRYMHINVHTLKWTLFHICEPSGGGIYLPILRVPSVNFQNLPPVKKIKYQKILTYILRSIFLKIPHLELPRWGKTLRDTNGHNIPFMQCGVFLYCQTLIINGHLHNKIVLSVHFVITCIVETINLQVILYLVGWGGQMVFKVLELLYNQTELLTM
jgi:hypothetical protein